jgi:hypothetical protein
MVLLLSWGLPQRNPKELLWVHQSTMNSLYGDVDVALSGVFFGMSQILISHNVMKNI